MKIFNLPNISRPLRRVAAMAILLAFLIPFASCGRLHEEMQECPTGARLRFVYDYNMEFANAFPSQCHCLTLLVFDGEGHYVTTLTASQPETADEDWRMEIPLPAGTYRFLAYAGMECDEASFAFADSPEKTVRDDVRTLLNPELITFPVGQPLHHHFYGSLDLAIPEAGAGTDLTEATVELKKNTNDIRIMLGHENCRPANHEEFDFAIISDNTLMNADNDVILGATRGDATPTSYAPWSRGNYEAGVLPTGNVATLAYADHSVSRLIAGHENLLQVTRRSDGKKIIDFPLNNLLLMLKSDRFRDMDPQEFLDRESRWNLTFLLTGDGDWLKTSIIVNGWVVRINEVIY